MINTITNIAQQQGDLQFILRRSTQIAKLNRAFTELLPESIRPHARLINYQCQTLIISCESSVWATRIRYLESILISQFKEDAFLKSMKFIKVKIQPVSHGIVYTTEKRTHDLSDIGQETIMDVKTLLGKFS